MLSKKMAFSLTSLITILALAFVVPTAIAASDGPKVTIETADHHFDDGKQVVPGAITVGDTSNVTLATEATDAIKITIKFSDPVNFHNGTDTPAATEADFTPADVQILYLNDKDVEVAAPTNVVWGQVKSTEYVVRLDPAGTVIKKVLVYIPDGIATAISGSTAGKTSQAATYSFSIIAADPAAPMPVLLKRLPPQSGFMADKVSGPFQVKIVLSENPKEFKAANIGISGGALGTVVSGGSIERWKYLNGDEDGVRGVYRADDNAIPADGTAIADTFDTDATQSALKPIATGSDSKFYRYSVTVTPDNSAEKVIVWVKDFEDRALGAKKYSLDKEYIVEGKAVPKDLPAPTRKLEVNVDLTGVDKTAAAAGTSVSIAKGTIIPMGGYLVVAKDDGSGANDKEKSSSTGIVYPGTSGKTADSMVANLAGSGRSLRAQKYNVVLGNLRDLETFLINDGTIDLITTDGTGAVISEIMWGTDASLADPEHNQWIEIRNTSGAQISTDGYKLMFYEANEDPPDMAAADSKIADRVSTRNWNIAGTGQSGRSSTTIGTGDDVELVATSDIISMQRAYDAAGMAKDGTMESGWASSERPSQNFMADIGGRVGSPGAMPINYPAPTPEPPPEEVVVIPPAVAADIVISEIMVDTGNGRLPQWIELNNISGKEVSLDGWSLLISNSAADTEGVIATSLEIDLKGTVGVHPTSGIGQTVLLVAWQGRSSSNLSKLGDRLMDVSDQVGDAGKGRYTLLSPMGFSLTLLPPQTTGIVQYGDMAGNLGAAEAWDIPMDDTGRSSLIRREMDAGMMTKGTDANGWVLASGTGLVDTPATWYGSDEDAGTPGVVGGGPLPVELSHFRPARDKATGAVVITWATQSELNNAGFFIKRSNQRNGEFKVINATMVAGAGTTSEKQFYTYTDTTAQPNIVYYYQIEDVSLDGNRQTLTRGIRLKGHIGAAGKLTSTWGELKSSNE